MADIPTNSNKDAWRIFLIEASLAQNRDQIHRVTGLPNQIPTSNPIVEGLLPSLLYIKMVGIIDALLDSYISSNKINHTNRDDLNGRINTLRDCGALLNSDELHELRKTRNKLAHSAFESCTWQDLENGICVSQMELNHLRLIGDRPQFSFFAERNPRSIPEPGCCLTWDFTYGLKQGDKLACELSFSQSVFDDSASTL